MQPKIVVVGSANTDLVVKTHHLPQPGETVLGGRYFNAQGGKGANQAVAAARLGAQVTFIARLGQDAYGDAALQAYQNEGIDTRYVFRDPDEPSGVALILVNEAGENMITVAPGANSCLSPADIAAAEEAIGAADCLLVQLEIPLEAVQAAVQAARKHGVRVILNPAPAAALPAAILQSVDIITPNENEARLLAGSTAQDPQQVAQAVREKTGVPQIVMTLGSKGALLDGPQSGAVPAYKVSPVDTTAAGDAFNGGLAVGLARSQDLAQAAAFACAVGALAATRPGAQPSLPTLEEVEGFLKTA